MRLHLPLAIALATLVCVAVIDAQIYLDADTPATGSDILMTPLVTAYGTISFVGELFSPASDPDFIAAGASGAVFDVSGSPSTATMTFGFDVSAITFVYGGNGGSIRLEARNSSSGVVDTFFQPDTGTGQPAGPITLSGSGIRSLWWTDPSGSYAAIDNVTIDVGLSCTLAGPATPASGDVMIDLDSSSATSMTVDATFEFSLDAGVTFAPCTDRSDHHRSDAGADRLLRRELLDERGRHRRALHGAGICRTAGSARVPLSRGL